MMENIMRTSKYKSGVCNIKLYKCVHKLYQQILIAVENKKLTPGHREIRAQLAVASPIKLSDGTQIVFINKLQYYNSLLYINGIYPTINQLNVIMKELNNNGYQLCPMIVWATQEGVPILVRVKPSVKNPTKKMYDSSYHHLAYAFIILSELQDEW
jgi:hypothetical protein